MLFTGFAQQLVDASQMCKRLFVQPLTLQLVFHVPGFPFNSITNFARRWVTD
jgi:hypothetical protein